MLNNDYNSNFPLPFILSSSPSHFKLKVIADALNTCMEINPSPEKSVKLLNSFHIYSIYIKLTCKVENRTPSIVKTMFAEISWWCKGNYSSNHRTLNWKMKRKDSIYFNNLIFFYMQTYYYFDWNTSSPDLICKHH